MTDICAHLSDGELSVAEVAQRQRVTPRYVHKLFENERLTFTFRRRYGAAPTEIRQSAMRADSPA